ncbi:DgyrCDS2370 [Dimorphilus gyrociliatus]|uniref:DgyrCDS2370 n=1 Tax=Dimorphilus gyrociliatus TaxID=2664684 RepID=A0A7I8VD57_9ANNE|nr:DgyrCDS2370 [Dimorphilus gyrociliatus]
MKCLLAYVALSAIVFCEANLPGLPFLQSALFKKRSSGKRFTVEEAADADAQLQRRIQTECYPKVMACCAGNPNSCAQCENDMTKCVHRITSEIYASYNYVYPDSDKKRSAHQLVARAVEKTKRQISKADILTAQKNSQQRAMTECNQPAQEFFMNCLSSGKSQNQCSSEVEAVVAECSKKIAIEEFSKFGMTIPSKRGIKRQISNADLEKMQRVVTQRVRDECSGPAQESFMKCLGSGKSQGQCSSELEPMVVACSNKIAMKEYAKLGITIPGKRDLKRQTSQADLQRVQQITTQRAMIECRQPAQNFFLSCMGKGQSPEQCSSEVEAMVMECSTRIAQEEYVKIGISLPSKRNGHKRAVSEGDIQNAQSIASNRAMTECRKPTQDFFMDCLRKGNPQEQCSREAESVVVECSNKIVQEEFAKIGFNLQSLSKREEITYEQQMAIAQEIQEKCSPQSDACFKSCQDFQCFDKCQLELSACTAVIYQNYGIEIIDKKRSL